MEKVSIAPGLLHKERERERRFTVVALIGMPKGRRKSSPIVGVVANNPWKRNLNLFDSRKWSKIIQEGRLQGAIQPHPAFLPSCERNEGRGGAILIYRSGAEPIARLKEDARYRLERLCRRGFDEKSMKIEDRRARGKRNSSTFPPPREG